ncbi:MAG TPA: DUF1800 domain-containing protein [Thermomicrobiales bacterium]|jgi:uncharacterized protein (DUF1800 family)
MAIDERRQIAHLLRRAGFGATPAELDEYVKLGFDDSVDRLLHPEDVEEGDVELPAELNPDPTRLQSIQLQWLYRMVNTNRPLAEKIAFFWHGHFATSIEKVKSVTLMWNQYETLRDNGLGKFEDLVLAVSKDPAMLVWLDNSRSRKEAPNENYGRELMERFTLGVGNYTEDDVKAASRAFTGWSIQIQRGAQVGDEDLAKDPQLESGLTADELKQLKEKKKNGTLTKEEKAQLKQEKRTRDAAFIFRPAWHDDGQKTYLGQTGNWDGADVVRIVTEDPACAEFVARSLFSFFVWDNPDDKTLAPFVDAFTKSGGDIRETLGAIFRSPEFSSDQAYRALVKSPIEVLVSTVKLLDLDITKQTVNPKTVQAMGQVLFAPPNVGGWTSGLGWIGPSSLLERYNVVGQLLSGGKKNAQGGFDQSAFLGDAAIKTADDLVDLVVARMLDGDIEPDQRTALVTYLALDDKGATSTFSPDEAHFADKLRGLIRLATTVPTYQLN